MKLTSFETKYDLQRETTINTAKFALSEDIKATFFTTLPDCLAGIALEADSWSVEHHYPSRDTKLKFKSKAGPNTKLTITQHVPQNKWYLVPNPEFKLVHKNAVRKDSMLELEWDMLERQGSAEMSVYGGEDKDYKAAVKMHSKKGVSVKARAKLHKGALHSVAAEVGTLEAPEMSIKSKFGDSVKVKTSVDAGKREVKISAKQEDEEKEDGGPAMTKSVALTLPYGGSKGGGACVVFGFKWKF